MTSTALCFHARRPAPEERQGTGNAWLTGEYRMIFMIPYVASLPRLTLVLPAIRAAERQRARMASRRQTRSSSCRTCQRPARRPCLRSCSSSFPGSKRYVLVYVMNDESLRVCILSSDLTLDRQSGCHACLWSSWCSCPPSPSPTDAYGGVPARYRICRIRERNAIRRGHAGPAGNQGANSERHADPLGEAGKLG